MSKSLSMKKCLKNSKESSGAGKSATLENLVKPANWNHFMGILLANSVSMTYRFLKGIKTSQLAVVSMGLMISMASVRAFADSDAKPSLPTITDLSTVTIRLSHSDSQSDKSSPLLQEATDPTVASSTAIESAIDERLAQSQIIDLATQQVLTPEQFVAQLAGQDYVILGEFHDSKAQHKLAYWLLERLQQQRQQGSLLLEMMSVDQQPRIEEAAQLVQFSQRSTIDLNQLKQALAWQDTWDWSLYGAIVSHPIEHDYPLVATNLTTSEVSAMMQRAVPITGYEATSATVKATIKDSILANHNLDGASAEDMAVVDKMVEIQQHRDRRMAEKILSSPSPSLLLTGNFHAQKAVGVPVHLADLQHHQPNTKQGVVVKMVTSLEDLSADPPTNDADYAWIISDD